MFNYRTCCRLCLKDKKIIVNCTEINNLCVKIENLFGFKVLRDDGYSTKICRDCVYQVTNFAVFKEAVLNNQKTIENYKNLETKIEAIKSEESDDDVILVTEEERAEVTSSTVNGNVVDTNSSDNEISHRNSISSRNKQFRTKKLKVVLEHLDQKYVMGLKMKRKDRKVLNFRTRRKSFINGMKELNVIISDEIKEQNQLDTRINKNKTLEDVSNSCNSEENLQKTENVDNLPLHIIRNQDLKTNQKQTSILKSRNENKAITDIQSSKNIQEIINSKESRISISSENISKSDSTQQLNVSSQIKPTGSINTCNPNFSIKAQNVSSNESSTVDISLMSCSSTNIEPAKSLSDIPIMQSLSNSVSSNITLNSTNNLSPVLHNQLHHVPYNNSSTMPIIKLSTASTAQMQSQKPKTIILKTASSAKEGVAQSSYSKRLTVSSSSTSTAHTKPPIKICKISTLMTTPSTSSVSNVLHLSNNSVVQPTLKNGVNANNLIFIKSNSQTTMNSNLASTSNSANVQTLNTQTNEIHIAPSSVHNQQAIGNEHLSKNRLSSFLKPVNNSLSDHRVKVLSVNELNSRAVISASRDQHQQWTVESPSLSSQKLPIRITLSRLRDKIRIKLTDHSMSDIHFNSLTLQERVAVRRSLLQPSSKLKIVKAIQECSLDAYSEDLLNSIGLRYFT